MDLAFCLLENVDEQYLKGTLEYKRELIGSMFPEKLVFEGVGFRTSRVNEFAQAIFNLGAAFS